MKKTLFISVLITVGIIVCSCGQKNHKTTSDTTKNVTTATNNNNVSNTSNNVPTDGTYNASGTITLQQAELIIHVQFQKSLQRQPA